MKTLIAGGAALLLATLCWTSPALAQGIPEGSYLRSCNGARVEGDTLIARCRRVDGFEQRSALPDMHRCAGDIANDNGQLRCNYRPGPPPGPPPGYYERCEGLRHEAHDLRERIERTWNPVERARLEEHLRDVHYRLERCPPR